MDPSRRYHSLFSSIVKALEAKHLELQQMSLRMLSEAVAIGADNEVTTRMDQAFEEVILDEILRSGLSGDVLSEEKGRLSLNGGSPDVLFIADPLDGTTNAISGFPFYASSLGVMEGEEIVAGLIYHLSTGDVFQAFRGQGATRNSVRLSVTPTTSLKEGQLVMSRPLSPEEEKAYFSWMKSAGRFRHTGCPTLDCCYVAAGTFAASIDYHLPRGKLCSHDIAAASLIVEEAGGLLLDERGNQIRISSSIEARYNIFAVNNRAIFNQLIEYVDDRESLWA